MGPGLNVNGAALCSHRVTVEPGEASGSRCDPALRRLFHPWTEVRAPSGRGLAGPASGARGPSWELVDFCPVDRPLSRLVPPFAEMEPQPSFAGVPTPAAHRAPQSSF